MYYFLMAAKFAAFVLSTVCVADRPWFSELNSFPFPSVASTQLNPDSFDWTSPNSWQGSCTKYALINFYAPWCPHCQHFAPEFERLSKELADDKYPASQAVFTGSVDCVEFADLCHLWNVTGYPTLRFGTCEQWFMPNATAHLQHINFQLNTAEKVAVWINDNSDVTINISQILSQENFGQQVQNPTQVPSSEVLDSTVGDVQIAVALLFRHAFATHDFQGERRQVLLDFIHLLADRLPELGSTAHGSTPCRTSLQELHSELTANNASFMTDRPIYWGSSETEQFVDPNKVEEHWRLCDTDWQDYASGWVGCRGTWPGTRGYTCGVWSLIHTLARASANDASISNSVMKYDHDKIRAMLWYFFDCNGCRDHFFQIPVSEEDVADAASNQLWWWFAHNMVNDRLGKLESSGHSGDPNFPHVQWPTAEQAPNCRHTPEAMSLLSLNYHLRRSSPMELSLVDSSTQCGLDFAQWSSAEAVARKGPAPKVGDSPLDAEASTMSQFLTSRGWNRDCVGSFLNAYYGGL